MSDPYQLLGVPPSANDEAIRSAYLAKVREHPPDRSPKRFQAIRRAYETIENPKARAAFDLFHITPPDLESLCVQLMDGAEPARPNEKQIREMLLECLLEQPLGKDTSP